MKTLVRFVKATLVGGIVFLLPFGIIAVVVGKLYVISRGIAKTLHSRLFPDYEQTALLFLMAVGILLLIAFLAGAFALTSPGKRMFIWLEEAVLSRLPVYTIFRQMVVDMGGGTQRLSGGEEIRVVRVDFDDQSQIGFVVDDPGREEIAVFLPGAPTAISGSVAIVGRERVRETVLAPPEVVAVMRRMGAGILGQR